MGAKHKVLQIVAVIQHISDLGPFEQPIGQSSVVVFPPAVEALV